MSRAEHRVVDTGTAAGAYSPAVIADGLCWVAGQAGHEFGTLNVVPGGIEAETTQTLKNIATILGKAGLGLKDIVSATVYMLETDEWAAMNAAYGAAFAEAGVEILPARTAVTVAGLGFGIRVEISVVARVPA